MDKQKEKQQKDTEQLILDAAIKEFATKGFDGARTSAIAAEAGVTHAMLHYYFRTKENLFDRIFRSKIGYIMNLVMSPIIESEGSIKERIVRGVESHFDMLMTNKELPIFFITSLNSKPGLYVETVRDMFPMVCERMAKIQTELDRAHERGEIARVDAVMLMLDIASINIFPVLAYPLFKELTGNVDFEEYMELRKRENIEIILKRIS